MSSFCERGKRLLTPRGPSDNQYYRNKNRENISNRCCLKKSGYKRSPKSILFRAPKYFTHNNSRFHQNNLTVYEFFSDYVCFYIKRKIIDGKVIPTNKRILKARKIIKSIGGDRTNRMVGDIEVITKPDYKGSSQEKKLFSMGRSFSREIFEGVTDSLSQSKLKPGDIITSNPTSTSRLNLFLRCGVDYRLNVLDKTVSKNGCWFMGVLVIAHKNNQTKTNF